MPSIINPIGPNTGAVIYDYVLLKGDGSPGESQSPPEFTVEPADLLDVVVRNPGPGVFEAEFVHNGSVGQAVVTASMVDGDLGEGVTSIGPFTDTIEARGALGAESAGFTARAEQAPTAAPPVEPPVA